MKHHVPVLLSLFCGGMALTARTTPPPDPTAIPWSEIGAKADAQYSGDGLSIVTAGGKTVLKSMLQRLEGEATEEGLWVSSVSETEGGGRFRIRAESVGRMSIRVDLAATGNVAADDERIRWVRPGLVEEYSTGSDGIRQDFVVLEKPAGNGDLRVGLSVAGARVEGSGNAVRLVVESSGRVISYGRLHVTDANGKELVARMEANALSELGIIVADAGAVYPLRIDPTFSDADWDGGFGAALTANAIAVDGSGILFVASYDGVGYRIAQWNGNAWSNLGTGMNGEVKALAVSGTDIYAAGNFTTAGGVPAQSIAKWDGLAWSALGTGVRLEYETMIPFPQNVSDPGTICALAVSGSDVYAGGLFTSAGGVPANSIAKWNGSGWSALGSGMSSYLIELTYVYALAVNGADLYAGGAFISAGGLPASNIAKWDGSAWSALGSGLDGWVYALAVSGADLFVGGNFTEAGGESANRIALWSGGVWSTLGSGMDDTVLALGLSGSGVYAGGRFTTAGGVAANKISVWNGNGWSSLGDGIGSWQDDYVSVLAMYGSDVYAGGAFIGAGGEPAQNIAKWDGGTWSGLGAGMNGEVEALAVSGTEVYAGGTFSIAGGVPAMYVAMWNGSRWSALGSGLSGRVQSLAVSGTDVYAGGSFSDAGGVAANNIAKWDGNAWSALGSGLNSTAEALVAVGPEVYAGGWFSSAGGVPANYIAKWNGNAWSALGLGTDGVVYSLAVSGSDVYAGGQFTMAGGQNASRIAKWNGTSWSALGSGVNGTVRALALSGANVYAGGHFSTAGGGSATRIAKWDGLAWSPLGSGMNIPGAVRALTVSGTSVYAGGTFTTAGGVAAKYVSKWDGTSWSALGSGLDRSVNALALADSDLWIGGSFQSAGSYRSSFIAIARDVAHVDKPEIMVKGNTLNINDGDITPSAADHTDFGGVPKGGTAVVRTFTVSNTGTLPLTLGTVTVPAGFTLIEGLSASLDPGADDTFTVQLENVEAGTKTGQISFSTNDPDENPFNFSITGTVLVPEIAVEQPAGNTLVDGGSSISFGAIAPGVSTALTFVVRNTGNDDLTGIALSLEEDAPADFMAGALGATVLAPGASTTFHVTFNPGVKGAHTATLRIASSDEDENPFDLILTGHRLTALEAWRKTNFGITNNTSVAADSADEDQDGIPNIVEFALDLDTTENSAGELPHARIVAGNLEVSFDQPSGVEGVVFGAEWSTSLPLAGPTPVPNTGVPPQHKFSVPLGPHARIYLRLTVTPQ